jgi:DNA-binding beta-propeller fold protein YncE
VFTFNGKGRNVTAIDARTNEVLGSLALDAKPEFAVTDGAGRIFVNLEDRNSIALIDPRKLVVRAVWPLADCDSPTGLALDQVGHRLFSACDKALLVIDADSGHVIAKLPTGDGVDAVAFDPRSHLVFASGGDGTLTVIAQSTANSFDVVQTALTSAGARTMTVDPHSGKVFLTTAKLGPRPAATAEQPRPRPAIVPGTFELLVLEP